jgi:hypothetical protein
LAVSKWFRKVDFGAELLHWPNYNWTATCNLFLAARGEYPSKGCSVARQISADALCGGEKRLVERADEKPAAFLELESAVHAAGC